MPDVSRPSPCCLHRLSPGLPTRREGCDALDNESVATEAPLMPGFQGPGWWTPDD